MQTVFANRIRCIAFNSPFPTDNKAHGICLSFQEFISSYFSSLNNYISLVLRLRWQISGLSKWQLHWRTSGEQRLSVSNPLGEWGEVRQAYYQNVTSWCWKLSSEGSTCAAQPGEKRGLWGLLSINSCQWRPFMDGCEVFWRWKGLLQYVSSLIIIKFHGDFAGTCACDIPFFFMTNIFLITFNSPH